MVLTQPRSGGACCTSRVQTAPSWRGCVAGESLAAGVHILCLHQPQFPPPHLHSTTPQHCNTTDPLRTASLGPYYPAASFSALKGSSSGSKVFSLVPAIRTVHLATRLRPCFDIYRKKRHGPDGSVQAISQTMIVVQCFKQQLIWTRYLEAPTALR